ncbi:MAG: C40 family peptidase [Bacteroidetes bacterium]|nr:C40 family peptidase [Bacteroidota bacterium]MCL1968899.1 C40 family peptidase [Bacteroidota bacterium]MCL1969014.1 C40 family peptidase [Bacteroidota bacterium]
MKYGVTHLSQISMRAEPSHKSQLVSQLLFGDAYHIEDIVDDWVRIKTLDCGYEGFIEKKLWNVMHEDDATEYHAVKKYIVNDYLIFIKEFETNVTFPVFMGSSFPYPQDNMLILGNAIFIIELPETRTFPKHPTLSEQQSALLHFASGYLRASYLWGGRTPAGIDCSALVQLAFKSVNISLPRDASQQVNYGTQVDFVTEWQVGDVAFFDNEEGNIIHVGIICGKDKILHASGYVKIDILDTTGIYNKQSEQYTHRLRVVKRVIND